MYSGAGYICLPRGNFFPCFQFFPMQLHNAEFILEHLNHSIQMLYLYWGLFCDCLTAVKFPPKIILTPKDVNSCALSSTIVSCMYTLYCSQIHHYFKISFFDHKQSRQLILKQTIKGGVRGWVNPYNQPPRCWSAPNAGESAIRPELNITFIHMWEWRFLILTLSLWLFWRKCIFCVFWGDFHSALSNLAIFLFFRHVLCHQKLLLTS